MGGGERGREERDFIVTFHVVIPIELRKCLAKSLCKKKVNHKILHMYPFEEIYLLPNKAVGMKIYNYF